MRYATGAAQSALYVSALYLQEHDFPWQPSGLVLSSTSYLSSALEQTYQSTLAGMLEVEEAGCCFKRA